MNRAAALFVASVFCVPVVSAPAQVEPASDAPRVEQGLRVTESIRTLMQDRKYDEAIQAIDQAAQDPQAVRDDLAWVKARALYLKGQYDEAAGAFEAIEKEHAGSRHVRPARYGKALCLMRKGDFRSAEEIYRNEATWLLSDERKQEIAGIYLEFAYKSFKPADENTPPDYNKALGAFLQALDMGPQPDRRPQIELDVTECYVKLGNLPEAAARLQKFIADHPQSALLVEARYRLGEAQLNQGQNRDARRTWQDLLVASGGSDSPRLAEAAFHLSRTHGIPQPATDEDLLLGVKILHDFLNKYADHTLSGQAHLWIAQATIHRGRYEEAVAGLERFLADARYAERDEIPLARNLLGHSLRLQKKFVEAVAAWREYLSKHPSHKSWSAVQQQIIDTEFLRGQEEQTLKHYDAARQLWTEFLERYPLDGRSPAILYEFGAMHHAEEKWEEALADWRRLVSKYPNTEESSRGQFMIGQTLEQSLGRLDEALKEYRKLNWGSFAAAAQQQIQKLTSKSLAVVTDRVFRTDETPTLKLTTRNLDKVTISAYTVDLETYFRKMHLARGVEALDIALIDPDNKFEFTVPNYADYRELESAVEVPLPKAGNAKAGVMAVTVSSPTLEATTLVVQSDLDLIIKSSRNEVFVFAENMRTGQPWNGARLLVSNGSQVIAEAATGDDGVFQKALPELASTNDVRVFAVSEGHVASNIVDLSGVGVAQGLTDKGYVYTDRPAYRAGQLVHVRGVIRKVQADAYTVEKGKKFTLEVFDPRSRLLYSHDVSLSDFGSFHGRFPLPEASVQGEYRVLVRDADLAAYQGSFVVQEYQLEPVQLAVEVDRSIYYRGEEIEGKITARYYYGAPLAGREVRYQFAGGPVETAATDDKGEIRFKFSTRDFLESQPLLLVAALPELNLQTGRTFFLATQGFTIEASTVRPVYLAGETFEAALKTVDAEGKPIAQKLTLKLIEQTEVDGQVGERMADSREVATGEDGTGRATLKVEKGGRYIVRAEGVDRFQNPVSGQSFVQISDDSDNVRLRILAERHTYKVGDTAEVQIHWREAPALALVTWQGARVLGHELVGLQTGANTLRVPMTAVLAPNFELAVAVMIDSRTADSKKPAVRFHEASSPFTVERELKVAVTTKRKEGATGPIRPGEEIEVSVATTDPQGNPVSAEVGLALVERALLDRFPARESAIGQFFRGSPRETAVRTTSSITFSYQPQTHAIDARLLAERERLEVLAEESARLDTFAGEGRAGGFGVGTGGAFGARNGEVPLPPAASRPAQMEEQIGQTLMMSPDGRQQMGYAFYDALQKDKAAEPALRMMERFRAGIEGEADVRGEAEALAGGKPLSAFGIDLTWNADDYGNFNRPMAATELSLGRLTRGKFKEVVVLTNGVQKNLNLSALGDDPRSVAELAASLSSTGSELMAPSGPQETGYWNPAIVTDQSGQASITLTVPDRTTAWRLLAKGVTADTLAGEADDNLVAKKDLFGTLKLPLAFTDGDQAEVEATVHNDALDKGTITVTLKTSVGDKTVEEKQTIEVTAKGQKTVVFKAAAARANGTEDTMRFELAVSAGALSDVVRQSVPLLPYGRVMYVTAGGSATSDTTAWVEAPAGVPLTSPSLEVIVGPTVERSLLDVLFGPVHYCQVAFAPTASGLDAAASDLFAALSLQKLFGGTRDAANPQTASLDGRVRSSLGLIVAAQNDDGGWSWTGKSGPSDRYASSRIVWAMALARRAGYTVPQDAFDRATAWLVGQVAATRDTDHESKAILLHALATAGQGDFALANRLHRSRPALSTAALAHLALAFAEIDRKPMAQELLDLLAARNLDDPSTSRVKAGSPLPWSSSAAELRALYALALQAIDPQSPRLAEQVDWLLAHRTGTRWLPDKATGPAVLALSDWFARERLEGEKYTLKVFVNNLQVQVLDLTPEGGAETVAVPADLIKPGQKQRINFELVGRGRYTYQCLLSGFVPADKFKGTVREWHVNRVYEPAPIEMDGKPVGRGFGVLSGGYTTFRNPLTQLAVGDRGHVEINCWRDSAGRYAAEDLEYLVITEPIPSGATVVESSVRGGFERFEIGPGQITFYVGNRPFVETIQFDVYGYLPGSYRAAPTVVTNAYRPDQIAVSEVKPLAVLAAGSKSADEYQYTPDELYELGRRSFAKGDLDAAGAHLTELFSKWNLNPDPYRETARMLLDVHLKKGPAASVVKYFEIIKEKWPDLEIPFEKILDVATAYHEIGEYERSFLVFRTIVEGRFLRESSVPGFLEAQGEFLRSVDVMQQLLSDYPPEPYAAAAHFALSQRVYAKAPEAASDPRLRELKVNRVDLIRQAIGMLDDLLTVHPDDPAADQAGFSVANALLELELYPQAMARSSAYAARYPNSPYLDSFWYVIGYCHFAEGQHQEALSMCNKVAEAMRLDPASGRDVESTNKWRAIYIMGQVHHSQGNAPQAIEEYAKVADRFDDAREAIAYFDRRAISLPEVTGVKPGESAAVELSYRNVASCDTKVYRIDLMKFSLLNRDLAGITRINLAGIRPTYEATVELGTGKEYADKTRKLELPLNEEGAYLVVCRGADLHASGLVLVTPLALEVQEEAVSGRVRATVKDVLKNRLESGVHVKVIGTRNDDFTSGSTDLRGVFVADSIQGTSTVIAQADGGRFAFFRGITDLGPPPAPAQMPAEAPQGEPMRREQSSKDVLLEGLQGGNRRIQELQQDQLKGIYNKNKQGVSAQEAY